MLPEERHTGNLSLSLSLPGTDHQIRVVGEQQRPEWIAKDICEALEIGQPANILREFDDDEKGMCTIHTLRGPQELLTVTEPGLYRLVLKSRKPAAQKFKRWICHEVLPALRTHGCYPPPPVPSSPTAIMLRQLADTVERQDELTTKVDYLEGKVRDLDSDTGYVTVLAYCRLKNIDLPRKDAAKHGKALAKIHHERKVKIGQVPDERYGKVNSYRTDIVEEYFDEVS